MHKSIKFENQELGTMKGLIVDDNYYFDLTNVGKILGLKNPREHIKKILDRHKKSSVTNIDTALESRIFKVSHEKSINRKVFINEPLLYALIFKSNKDKAIRFQEWIYSEVIPSIRKYGQYRMEGKLIRKSLTDTIKESGENERLHNHGYSLYTNLIKKHLNIPKEKDKNDYTEQELMNFAKYEDLVRVNLSLGKDYNEIKQILGDI